MPNQLNTSTPGEPFDSFDDQVAILLEELSLAFEWKRPSILLAEYASEAARLFAQLALEKALAGIKKRIVPVQLNARLFDAPLALSRHAQRQKVVYFVSGLSRGGGRSGANAYRALNMRRELLVDGRIRAVFWVTRQETVELSQVAPDFWAFRHRMVEFGDPARNDQVRMLERQLADRVDGSPVDPKSLDAQIILREALLADFTDGGDAQVARSALLHSLARLYRLRGDALHSLKVLKAGMDAVKRLGNPGLQALFWEEIGAAYSGSGNLRNALEAYNKVTQLDSERAGAWESIGLLLFALNRLPEAVVACERLVAITPEDFSAHVTLAACYRSSGRDDLAMEQVRIAQSMPKPVRGYERARFEAVSGNVERASRLLRTALRKRQVDGNRLHLERELIWNDPHLKEIVMNRSDSASGKS